MSELWHRIRTNVRYESIELLVAFAAVSTGLLVLFNSAFIPVILIGLPSWLLYSWAAMLFVGGLTNGMGLLITNIYLRRMGLILMAGASAFIFAAVLGNFTFSRFFASSTYFLAALAFIARYRVLGHRRDVFSLRARLEAARRRDGR